MDLLEYQGKQLFARARRPSPEGQPADHARRPSLRRVDRFPVCDQGPGGDRQAGQGRGNQGRRGRGRAVRSRAILGMDIRGPGEGPSGSMSSGSRRLGDRRRALRLDHPRPLGEEAAGDPLRMGGMDVEEVAERTRRRWSSATSTRLSGSAHEAAGALAADARGSTRMSARGSPPADRAVYEVFDERGRDPDRGRPADRHLRPPGRRARREGDDRRLGAVPPRGAGGDRGPPPRTRRSGSPRRRA